MGGSLLALLVVVAAQDDKARIGELEKRIQQQEEELQMQKTLLKGLRDGYSEIKESAKEQEKPKDDDFRVFYKTGLNFESGDGNFKVKLGGRIHDDWLWWLEPDDDVEDAVGRLDEGTEFRRARLFTSGTLFERVEFKAQYDFTDGDADFKDLWLGVKGIPIVNHIRVGQMKEPFGLEELTSSNTITFMERSTASEAFAPSRNTGLMVFDTALEDDRLWWGAGVFRDTDDFGDDPGGGEFNITAHLTGLPYWEDDGKKMIHLGAAVSRREANENRLRRRSRPEIHNGPRFVDTGNFAADDEFLAGLEGALVYDGFSLQGEWMIDAVNRERPSDDVTFTGGYIQASFWITGEHRPYKRSDGAFDRVKPIENFLGKEEGVGAWEVAIRWSTLDLTDDVIAGGELDGWTLGVNWHLNPQARWMLNLVVPDLDDVGTSSAMMMRFQIDF